MATRKEKTGRKVEQRRRLTLFFNEEARHSAASALNKASWMMAAANAYLGFRQGSLAYMAVLVVGWLVTQALAVVLLSIEEKEGSQGPEEQKHGNIPEARRRRAHT